MEGNGIAFRSSNVTKAGVVEFCQVPHPCASPGSLRTGLGPWGGLAHGWDAVRQCEPPASVCPTAGAVCPTAGSVALNSCVLKDTYHASCNRKPLLQPTRSAGRPPLEVPWPNSATNEHLRRSHNCVPRPSGPFLEEFYESFNLAPIPRAACRHSPGQRPFNKRFRAKSRNRLCGITPSR